MILVPGLTVTLVVGLAALWLSRQYGLPAILAGLLLGLALNFLAEHPALGAGLNFVASQFLRLGIVLLGLQVSFSQITAVGWSAFAGLLGIMGAAFGTGVIGARIIGEGRYAGILAGGATAICGASAALALYSLIGRDRLEEARFTVTLLAIAMASALALTFYPALAVALSLTETQAGYLVGASIHDVAQAIGGGFAISDEAGLKATVIKLARVALLAPVVALVALCIDGEKPKAQGSLAFWRRLSVPWFILGFFAMVGLASAVSVPPRIAAAGLDLSKFLLLLAVIATAMRARLSLMIAAGWRPFFPVALATLTSFAAAMTVTVLVIE